jgi:hypothetical protein
MINCSREKQKKKDCDDDSTLGSVFTAAAAALALPCMAAQH